MIVVLDSEFTQIQALLVPRKRRQAEVRGRLRHLMIMESNVAGDTRQPTDRELSSAVRRLRRGDTWQALFPGIATLRLNTRGHGHSVSIRLTRELQAAPVRVLRAGEPGVEEASMVREVNLRDRYSMGLKQVARNLGLREHDTLALIYHLGIREDTECYWEFRLSKSSLFKRYSPLALERLEEASRTAVLNEAKAHYKYRTAAQSPSTGAE